MHGEASVLLDVRNFVALLATLGVGLLSGIMVGTGLAGVTARALPEASWVLRFQLEDRLFAKAMPPLMLSTLLALSVACVLARRPSTPASGSKHSVHGPRARGDDSI